MDRSKLKSILFGYLWFESKFWWYFGITSETKDLTVLTTTQKNEYLRKFDINGKFSNAFYSASLKSNTVLQPIWKWKTKIFGPNVARYYVFVPKLYHDRASSGFLNYFSFQCRINASKGSFSEFDRTFQIYKKKQTASCDLNDSELDFIFPDKNSKSMGFIIREFDYTFPKAKDPVKTLVTPAPDLINKVNGTEESLSVPTEESFYPQERALNPIQDGGVQKGHLPVFPL